jgi:asparagine N-glycosylation enzyme membrane subunit Stt3
VINARRSIKSQLAFFVSRSSAGTVTCDNDLGVKFAYGGSGVTFHSYNKTPNVRTLGNSLPGFLAYRSFLFVMEEFVRRYPNKKLFILAWFVPIPKLS